VVVEFNSTCKPNDRYTIQIHEDVEGLQEKELRVLISLNLEVFVALRFLDRTLCYNLPVTNDLSTLEYLMSASPASKDGIIDRLFTVFRDRGFDGASLADLSRATGLGKSSLYHYFPEGKEQMAEAVLARATALIDSAIVEVAQAPEPLKSRLRKIVAALEQLYVGGRTPCVLGQLATAAIGARARQGLREAFAHWIGAIAGLATESGIPPGRARHFAEDWVARLQGALILQAASGDTGPFKRAMNALLELAKEHSTRIQD
jgi:AcrR family transcriptional regulator